MTRRVSSDADPIERETTVRHPIRCTSDGGHAIIGTIGRKKLQAGVSPHHRGKILRPRTRTAGLRSGAIIPRAIYSLESDGLIGRLHFYLELITQVHIHCADESCAELSHGGIVGHRVQGSFIKSGQSEAAVVSSNNKASFQ